MAKLLGAHMSVEGGVHRALERGARASCRAVQVFTRPSQQWKARALEDEEADSFKRLRSEHGIEATASHASYLINMATPDAELRKKSVAALVDELERCDRLDIPYLIIHPGAHMGEGEARGIRRIASVINRIHGKLPRLKAKILLETTAGMGTSVGHTFEQLAGIIEQVEAPGRVDVCLDTCHLFAAGYDISTPGGYEQVMTTLEKVLGLEKVRAFHLNDSKKGLGCRLDRHEHIGRGALGVTAFWCLLNDDRFDGIPMVLETPKGPDLAEDITNLKLLRAQIGKRRPVRGPTVMVVASKAAHRGKRKKAAPAGARRRGPAAGGKPGRRKAAS